ncbi:uncharacterized protein LOC115222289 [Argonauta hians]
MSIVYTVIVMALGVVMLSHEVSSHGRLLFPPSRSSMWRFGFNNPKNYNDNQLYCGGFGRQWFNNNGKCGVCGDPYDGARENEAGGKYANGMIGAVFKEGDVISNVTVQLTTNHRGGYFEFNLCPVNNPSIRATESCFNSHPVLTLDGKRRYALTSEKNGFFYERLRLPAGVTCTQCVFRWKYTTRSSWGCDNTGCCTGCGHQEEFYGCADISITPRNDIWNPLKTRNPHVWKPTTVRIPSQRCQAKLPWRNNPAVSSWCIRRCSAGNCMMKFCEESCFHLSNGARALAAPEESADQFWQDLIRNSNSTGNRRQY